MKMLKANLYSEYQKLNSKNKTCFELLKTFTILVKVFFINSHEETHKLIKGAFRAHPQRS